MDPGPGSIPENPWPCWKHTASAILTYLDPFPLSSSSTLNHPWGRTQLKLSWQKTAKKNTHCPIVILSRCLLIEAPNQLPRSALLANSSLVTCDFFHSEEQVDWCWHPLQWVIHSHGHESIAVHPKNTKNDAGIVVSSGPSPIWLFWVSPGCACDACIEHLADRTPKITSSEDSMEILETFSNPVKTNPT